MRVCVGQNVCVDVFVNVCITDIKVDGEWNWCKKVLKINMCVCVCVCLYVCARVCECLTIVYV